MTTDGLRIRPATPEDGRAVADIWHAGWSDGHLGHVPEELVGARTVQSFRQRAAEHVADTVVAEIDGALAGFTMVIGDEVEQVYVAAAHRGTGVADALLSEAEARIRAAGHPRAWLAVVAGNARARRFYERSGWIDDGPLDYPAHGREGTIPVPARRYIKDLGSETVSR